MYHLRQKYSACQSACVGKGVPDGVVHTGMIKIAHRLSLPVEISGLLLLLLLLLLLTIIIIYLLYNAILWSTRTHCALPQSSTFSTLSEKNIKDSMFNKVSNTCMTTNDTYTQEIRCILTKLGLYRKVKQRMSRATPRQQGISRQQYLVTAKAANHYYHVSVPPVFSVVTI